jgi:hypothetical protein
MLLICCFPLIPDVDTFAKYWICYFFFCCDEVMLNDVIPTLLLFQNEHKTVMSSIQVILYFCEQGKIVKP